MRLQTQTRHDGTLHKGPCHLGQHTSCGAVGICGCSVSDEGSKRVWAAKTFCKPHSHGSASHALDQPPKAAPGFSGSPSGQLSCGRVRNPAGSTPLVQQMGWLYPACRGWLVRVISGRQVPLSSPRRHGILIEAKPAYHLHLHVPPRQESIATLG
jgi:hypothetical protein